jgi:hypothetical protein
VLTYYRHFYVKTEVERPWPEVARELNVEHSTTLHDFTDLVKPQESPRSLRFPGISDPKQEIELLRRWDRARFIARPSQHGGFGDPLPNAFVVFTLVGPEDHIDQRAQFHVLTYRLTAVGPNRTLVEVWDNKYFDS